MKIYIATCGDFDDFTILGAFIDIEKAKDCTIAGHISPRILLVFDSDTGTQIGSYERNDGNTEWDV